MKLHHLGIAVKDIETSSLHYVNSLGWIKKSDIIYDSIQNVNIQLMGDTNNIIYELIEPLDETSPVTNLLRKRMSLYHLCYEVFDLKLTISELSNHGYLLVSNPSEAVAFNGRLIAFLINQDNLTIELIEKE